MAILEHFLFNSDYPTDKIVYMHEGTIVAPDSWATKFDMINTHIKTMVYLEGDFKVAGSNIRYPLQDMYTDTSIRGYALSFMYNGECWVAPMIFNLDSGNTGKTVSYRIWAYAGEAEGKNTDIGATANVAKPILTLDSDKNYPRFVGDTFVSQGNTYAHNLGYIPLVKTWALSRNERVPLPSGTTITADVYQRAGGGRFSDDGNDEGDIRVSKTQIKTFTGSTENRAGYYCRMYVL